MKLWLIGLVTVLAGFGVCFGSAGLRANVDGPKPLQVVVTIAPLKGLIESLLPEGSTVTVLIAPGKSEHGYEFTPVDVAAVAKADFVVYVGLGLEGRVGDVLKNQDSPKRSVVCFADAVGIKAVKSEHEDDDHDTKGEHEHHEHGAGYVDPHLWLDPALVEKLVPVLRDAVRKVEQGNEKNKGEADGDATRLDNQYRLTTAFRLSSQ